jgi:hypothetical protein
MEEEILREYDELVSKLVTGIGWYEPDEVVLELLREAVRHLGSSSASSEIVPAPEDRLDVLEARFNQLIDALDKSKSVRGI